MSAIQPQVSNLEQYLATLDAEQVDRLEVAEFIMEVTLLAYALRQRKGVSQAEVAERLGKSQQAVSAFERPHSDLNLMSLCKYLRVLGYDLDLIVTDHATGERAGGVTLQAPVEGAAVSSEERVPVAG